MHMGVVPSEEVILASLIGYIIDTRIAFQLKKLIFLFVRKSNQPMSRY